MICEPQASSQKWQCSNSDGNVYPYRLMDASGVVRSDARIAGHIITLNTDWLSLTSGKENNDIAV